MHRIYFVKHFVGGILDGLSVPVAFTIDATLCCKAQANLDGTAPDMLSSDCLTGQQWYATDVQCSEVAR